MVSLVGKPILLLLLSFIGCHGFISLYPPNSDVIVLTEANFDELVTQSDAIWIVEFYSHNCGHCHNFAPQYDKAATALKGFVKVGAVNAAILGQETSTGKVPEKSLSERFGVEGFPTVKIFGANKNKPEDYNGAKTAQGLADAGISAIKSKISVNLGGKPSESSKGKQEDVIELTDSNFDSLVLNSEDMWLVEFYAPWCGHCKNLAPHWAHAATELKGKVKFGALDATVHNLKASKYGVQGYPTIKVFPGGKKDSSSVEDYNGGRTGSDIVNWALEKLAENVPAPEIKQIVGESVLKEACEDHPLCVVAVLPNILDCQANCRNEYIKALTTLGEKFKKKLWGWVWLEAGSHPELEDLLEIGGFGYPAMAVLNAKKMKYSILRGSFSYDGINEFLRDLSYGRGTTAPFRGTALPKIQSIEPWDGKDGELPVDEDIDLSDVDLEDLSKDEL